MGLPTELARRLGRTLPSRAVDDAARRALGEDHVALCLHRVHQNGRREGEALPEMSISASALDELVLRLVAMRPGVRGWLTLSFDDGYEDARAWIASRAPRFPNVAFRFFVCPERLESKRLFDWDEQERARAGSDDFALATVNACRELAKLPNVVLGNHTNAHENLATLSDAAVERELRESDARFTELFGPCEEFAFPFGTPHVAFGAREVTLLRAMGVSRIWSTEPRSFGARELVPGGVLPRFAVDGTWSVSETIAWIGTRAAVARVKRPEFDAARVAKVA